MGRKIRYDAYPEHAPYPDSGCSLAPRCLDCSLTDCRYDEPAAKHRRRQERAARAQEMLALREAGWSIASLTSRYRLSKRSCFRLLAEARQDHDIPTVGRPRSSPDGRPAALLAPVSALHPRSPPPIVG